MTGKIDEKLSAELWECATALADAAGDAILPHFRTALRIDDKDPSRFDPVTAADKAAEKAMRTVLAERRPSDAILGEEYGALEGTSGLTWVLDPIDGTRGFLSGTPTWGVLISVLDEHGPILGVIDQPYTGERWEGGLGRARHTDRFGSRELGTRDTMTLDHAILFSTFPEIGTSDEHAGFTRVANGVRLVRYGTDCYAHGLLALGQIDLVIEAGLHSYDVCGPIAVIEAAGGVVTNWEGKPAHEGGRLVAASTPELHAIALERLQG